MTCFFYSSPLLVLAAGLVLSSASPKKYDPEEGGFKPSHSRYYESSLPAYNNSTRKAEGKESRFGIPISGYGASGNGVQYPGGQTSYMISPMKLDIGGIALGALIGLGAILIVPKLAHALSGGYGYRSLETDMSAVTDILARIDDSLEKNNIDSSSCMQRIICSYVTDAQKNMKAGEANSVDEIIFSLSTNPLFTYMLDGTAVKEAIEMGKKGDIEKCSSLYTKCPINRENVVKVIASLIPA